MVSAVTSGVAWHTHRGRRDSNQDGALVHELDDDRILVAVADGMGGQAGGADASRRALEVLQASLDDGRGLGDAVEAANTAVYEQSVGHPENDGMGTTLVAVLVTRHRYWVANVGDSRAYRVGLDEIFQITNDHSFASEALASGTLSEDEVAASPWRNALTRAIGTDPEVEVDVFGPFSTDPAHSVFLCTDGIYRAIDEERIHEVVRASADTERIPEALADEAYRAGASDNMTIAMVSVGRDAPVPSDDGSGPPSTGGGRAPEASESTTVKGDGPGDSGRHRVVRRRFRRSFKRKQKVELFGATATVLLAALAAYVILSIL